MMEIEAGLCVLLRQGPYYDSPLSCLNLGRSEHAQPTLPQCHLLIHTLHVFYTYRTAMGGPANKCIYKYVQFSTYRINEKEGNHNYPKWGFDQGCLDMV